MTTKLHQKYFNKVGTVVPSITAIINDGLGWNKGILINWAIKEMKSGNDPMKKRDKAGDIGTCFHYLVECHLKKEKPDLSDYAKADIDKAENCFIGYLDWEDKYKFKAIGSEIQLVSEEYQFGGTLDMVGNVGDKLSVVEIKSSAGIYPEFRIQVAAQGLLWMENYKDQKIKEYHLLRIGKSDGAFEHHKYTNLDKEMEAFLLLKRLHELKQLIV